MAYLGNLSPKERNAKLVQMMERQGFGRIRTILPEGAFHRRGHTKALGMSQRGLAQVVSFMGGPPGLTRVLAELPPTIRADAFNHFADQSGRQEDVRLRTYLVPTEGEEPQRCVYSVVSPRYSAVSDSHALTVAWREGNLPDGGKVRLTREDGRTDMEIIFPMLAREICVGDLVYAAIHGWNSGNKTTTVGCDSKLVRSVCSNLTTVESKVEEMAESRHVGDPVRQLGAAVRAAFARIDPFVRAFGDAYRQPFPRALPTRSEVLERVQKRMALPKHVLATAAEVWDADG